MSRDHWWYDSDREKAKYWKKNPCPKRTGQYRTGTDLYVWDLWRTFSPGFYTLNFPIHFERFLNSSNIFLGLRVTQIITYHIPRTYNCLPFFK